MKSYLTEIQNEIGHKYWLGKVVEIHELCDYGIVEYLPFVSISDKSKGFSDEPMFATYIKGKSLGHSYDTLEAAITGAIACRYDGANTQAGSFFIRMIASNTEHRLVPHKETA